MFGNFFGLMGTITSITSFIPQIYKIYITKSSSDISMIMLINFLLCSLSWIIYGYIYSANLIIFSNFLCFICSMILIIQKLYYEKFKLHKEC